MAAGADTAPPAAAPRPAARPLGPAPAFDAARPGDAASEVSADDQELVWLLMNLAVDLRARAEALLTRFGLTGPQFGALQRLRQGGPLTMRDLAIQLHCDASNITGIADRLEIQGLASRHVDPADRRVKHLVLTDRGSRIADEIWTAAVTDSSVMNLPESTRVALLEALRDGRRPA